MKVPPARPGTFDEYCHKVSNRLDGKPFFVPFDKTAREVFIDKTSALKTVPADQKLSGEFPETWPTGS